MLEHKLKEKNDEIGSLKNIILENENQIGSLNTEMKELRKELLNYEKMVSGLKEEKQHFDTKMHKEKSINEYLKFQIDIFQKQISFLAEGLNQSDQTITKILKEKKDVGSFFLRIILLFLLFYAVDAKLMDFLKCNLEFQDVKLFEYFEKSVNFNFEVFCFFLE